MALLLVLVLYVPAHWFALFVAAIIMLGGWEWSRLSGLCGLLPRLLYTFSMLPVLYVLYLVPSLFPLVALSALVWWSLAARLITQYGRQQSWWSRPWLLLLAGYLVLAPGWMALVFLRSSPDFTVLIAIFVGLVASADIGAYFAGRRFGRHKLAPRVSPGKTLEGLAGGIVASAVFATVMLVIFRGVLAQDALTAILVLPALLLIVVLSVVGDLLESMVKRQQGVKDSGSILPGHGGVLDRIDSICAAAPAFGLLVWFSGGG